MEVRGDGIERKSDDGHFDETEGGFDDFSILGGDENGDGRHKLRDDVLGDVPCRTTSALPVKDEIWFTDL